MNSTKKKVLIIDDKEEIRDLIDVTLRGSEFEVFAASNGKEGIQKAKDLKPDIILLDVMMPVFDGFMTCSVLKRNPLTNNIPVIFLTAKKSKEDIQASIKAGGTDYILKPFSPSDLMTRLRNQVATREVKQSQKTKKSKTQLPPVKHDEKHIKTKIHGLLTKNIKRHGDVIVCSDISSNIVIENCNIYRDIFKNIVSDGIFKVVLDTTGMNRIDGAGLALLLSVNESLKNYGGELRITFPGSEFNNCLSFVNINDLVHGYNTIPETVNSFSETISPSEELGGGDNLNICMSCTYVNNSDARYCSYCGTNLIMGRGEQILKILRKMIARKITAEEQTNDIHKINTNRKIQPDKIEIPSEFNVELIEDNILLKYKSVRTIRKYYKTKNLIAIQAPTLRGKPFPLHPGMEIQLMKTQSDVYSNYKTEIKTLDSENCMIFVHYNEDAKIIHSQKNFSIATNLPISITIMNPSFNYSGKVMKGKILELSRIRIVVFTEDFLPEDECLAVSFILPGEQEISSPLAIASKRRERFMFNIEFLVIDEKEGSNIIQYMYKRQIEMAKVKEI